ncbi:MAG: porin family protein [Alphaproteobacteria bacterium]|nr:porin family protein [Alphaproteobacteria bacterium]
MIRKSLAATAALSVLTLGAMPVSAQPTAPNPWAGLYVGIGGHAGEAFGSNKLSFTDLTATHNLSFVTANNEDNMFVGGLQLGQLWPVGGVMLGLESDISFGKDVDYLASTRGVLGVPVGSFLIYGTGGVGQEIVQEDFAVSSTSGEIDNFTGKVSKYGWTAGGGIDALVAPHFSIGVEAIHYDFGRDSQALNLAIGGEPFDVIGERKFTVVRARVNYRFTSIF